MVSAFRASIIPHVSLPQGRWKPKNCSDANDDVIMFNLSTVSDFILLLIFYIDIVLILYCVEYSTLP